MNRMIFMLTVLAVFSSQADDTPGQARRALVKGAAFMRSISAEGGYLWRYSTDLQLVAGENRASRSMMWLQPPGTPSVGMALLESYQRTGERALLEHALAAGAALAQAQLASGGWGYRHDFSDPQRTLRRNITTFDDNTSQSCLRFLLAPARLEPNLAPQRGQLGVPAFRVRARRLGCPYCEVAKHRDEYLQPTYPPPCCEVED